MPRFAPGEIARRWEKQRLAAPAGLAQADCSAFTRLARIHHTETCSSKWIYGLFLFYCHCPGEMLPKKHRLVEVERRRRSARVAGQDYPVARALNDLIMKRQSRRILAIIQVLILPSSFFFFNLIFKSFFLKKKRNI